MRTLDHAGTPDRDAMSRSYICEQRTYESQWQQRRSPPEWPPQPQWSGRTAWAQLEWPPCSEPVAVASGCAYQSGDASWAGIVATRAPRDPV